MLLVYNCITESTAALKYEQSLIKKINTEKKIIFTSPGKVYQGMESEDFSHLIISGSAASAKDNNSWDSDLTLIINNFFHADKAILGICYGHQFLASWFHGKSCIYRMEKPEYCWNKVELYKTPLFSGVTSDIFCHIHNDSVSILPDNCSLIAKNNRGIQGFQYNGKKVFGIQFHPDYNYEEAKKVYKRVALTNSIVRAEWSKTAPGINTDRDGAKILTNFVNM